jgi:hypothetical protein
MSLHIVLVLATIGTGFWTSALSLFLELGIHIWFDLKAVG